MHKKGNIVERQVAVCVHALVGFSYRAIGSKLNCSCQTILRDVRELQRLKYIINVSNDPQAPNWKAGPNLPITILKEIRDYNLDTLKCDTPKKCDTPGSTERYPPSGVPQGYVSKVPTMFEILGGEYEPCFVHNVGYQFFITVSPSKRLDEWHLTCDPEKASGVLRHKLLVPISKDVDDDRTFTVLWTQGRRKEKMTVWMPEEILRNPEAILQYGEVCKGRLTKVTQWVENRYDCVLMFEKRLGRPEMEIIEEELRPEEVEIGRFPGEDEYFDQSKGALAYETTNKIKAADVSSRAKNARIVAKELRASRENQEVLLTKVSDIETIISELAKGQIVQGENLTKITNVLSRAIGNEKKPDAPGTDPGGMFG